MNETDEKLYLRFLEEGDSDDLRVLLERYNESLTLFLYGFVHDMEDAEELMMDAFAVAASGTSRFRGNSSFKTWLFAIGRNLAMKHLRKNRIRVTERLLLAFEKSCARYPRPDHRHRFEHFSMATDDQAKRAEALGCCLAMQPSYVVGDAMIRARVGEERMKRSLRFKTFMDMGFKVGGGSDAPVTPIDPFHGIACAMEHFLPSERMAFLDAMKMFTSDAAYLTFEEKERGSLSVGKYGDLVILDRNVLEMDLKDPQAVRSLRVAYTVQEGEIKYKK